MAIDGTKDEIFVVITPKSNNMTIDTGIILVELR